MHQDPGRETLSKWSCLQPRAAAHTAKVLNDVPPFSKEEKAACPCNLYEEVTCPWNQLVAHICVGEDKAHSTWSSHIMRIITWLDQYGRYGGEVIFYFNGITA